MVSTRYFFRSTQATEPDAENNPSPRSDQRLELVGKQARRKLRTRGNILSIVVPAADDAIQDSGRVLVVDTEPELRLALRAILSAGGLTVDDADSSAVALRMLRTGPFDLALFDINMPGINGLETCQSIRAECSASIVMLDLRGEGSNYDSELAERLLSGLGRTSRPGAGARRYRDPAILKLLAAAAARSRLSYKFPLKSIA